ncbi:Hypothetical predicted protein [Lecanosticta acicola]|uniref:Metallo-beta-lactamase domain-containing protein n=1 Tax=Lecanosticta acicola TaxID=111012 RepID=A0AAI8Z311_9PEZI|nr:Hypothetical predicted protein [Lecanosticta acicola]
MSIGPVKFDIGFWGDYLDAQLSSLPPLPSVERLSDRVTRILGGNPGRIALQGTNTYLVGTGRSRILLDTGQGKPGWIDSLSRTLESQSIQISHVLLTHWHGDHVGGICDLVKYDPRLGSKIHKWKPDAGQLGILDRQVFEVEGATLEAVHLPGHAQDHACFILKEEKALFTGDNVLGHGYSTSEDLIAYVQSLRQMLVLDCGIGYPGHGESIADLDAKIKEYLHVQETRELQICRALAGEASGSRLLPSRMGVTVEELARVLFAGVPEEVRKLSVERVLSENLWLLAAKGSVGFKVQNRERHWYAKRALTTAENSS